MIPRRKEEALPEAFLSGHSVYCLALSWLTAALILNFADSYPFTSKEYYRSVSFTACCLFVLAFWLLLRTVRSRAFIVGLMLAVSSVYCIRTIILQDDIHYTFGCCVLMGFIAWFSPTEVFGRDLSGRMLKIILGLVIALYTVWVGGICAAMYFNFGTPTYDFGIFAQMFYYMKKTGLPLTTCERDGLLSHFAVHMSPVYYLLLPLYCLIPSPATLEVGQCFVVISGVIPLVLLAKRFHLSNAACALFAGIYLSYPAFLGGCFFHIHENQFLTPLILWMFLAFESGRTIPMVVTTALVLSVKEDAAVYAVILILYYLIREGIGKDEARRKRTGVLAVLLVLSVVYFATVVWWISRSGDGAMVGRYSNYMYDGKGSLLTVIKAAVESPVYVLEQCFTDEKIFSTFLILLPMGGMAVWMSSWEELLLLVPYVLFNMMSEYYYQHILGYQYYFGSAAFLFFLCVLHYSRWKEEVRRKVLLFALAASLLICTGMYHGRLFDYLPNFRENLSTREQISEVLEVIPEDASVVSSTFLLSFLSDREEIYDIDYTRRICDYLALDLRYSSGREAYRKYEADSRFELVKIKEGAAAVFRSLPVTEEILTGPVQPGTLDENPDKTNGRGEEEPDAGSTEKGIIPGAGKAPFQVPVGHEE